MGEPHMPRTNPYRSPETADERSSATGRPQATARLVRGLEYVISLLIVMALVWVVHVFVLAGDLLP